MRIYRFLFIAFSLFNSTYAFAQDHGHDHEHQLEEKVKDVLSGRSSKKLTFKGYGSLRPGFRKICEGLLADHRIVPVIEILKANSDRDPLCGACRPLYRSIWSECSFVNNRSKPKKSNLKKTKVEEEESESADETLDPTPVPQPPVAQREPNTILIDRVSRVFNEIAEDEAINHQSVDAIAKLSFLLQDKIVVPNAAAREYFSILVSYMTAPFEGVTANNLSAEDATEAEKAESKEGTLDVIFDE